MREKQDMPKTASGLDAGLDAGPDAFLTSDVFSRGDSSQKCTILNKAIKRDRMQYVMDLLGESVHNYDPQVLLKSVDGLYGGLTPKQAAQLHDLAFEPCPWCGDSTDHRLRCAIL